MKVVVTEVELDIRSTDSLVIVALLSMLIQGMVRLKLEFGPFFFYSPMRKRRRCWRFLNQIIILEFHRWKHSRSMYLTVAPSGLSCTQLLPVKKFQDLSDFCTLACGV